QASDQADDHGEDASQRKVSTPDHYGQPRDEVDRGIQGEPESEYPLAQRVTQSQAETRTQDTDNQALVEKGSEQGGVLGPHRLQHGNLASLVEHDHDQSGDDRESRDENDESQDETHQDLLDP